MSAVDTTPTASSHTTPARDSTFTNQTSGDTTPTAGEKSQTSDGKSSVKKKLLGLVKKDSRGEASKSEVEQQKQSPSATTAESQKMTSPQRVAGLSSTQIHDLPRPRSASPNQASAASSLIFERNVQESVLSPDMASAIPAHIKTEDQIPPALEASSLAITDDHLGPEEVEVVTHTAHQNAATAIAESIPSARQSEVHLALSPQESQHEQAHLPTQHEVDDNASNYGSLDPNDVRRLSFISFADVMHGEHAETGSNQSLHHVPLSATTDPGLSQSPKLNRPVSPTRSPLSSFSQTMSPGITTPPTTASGPGSAKGVELSPQRSPSIGSPQYHGDLSIETLGQALRKTASRDLSGFNRSPPTSAI
ncbi:hypothetical protein C1H76_7108 [Elsinoe australis]|uniref:Uncharacterized protein n=1 Tax=Elsinoe australis TaxID=40998 RepID=A0A4V6DTI4_9PEZI|nr:hypothetical protein C1H76_7108 [Elsinoe australis]